MPIGDPGTWHLALDSEFTGTSLPSPWTTGWFGTGITQGVGGTSENDCYDPAQVSVGGDELDLNLVAKVETCGGVTHPYATGFVTTDGNYSYTYGFAEARIWMPGSSSACLDWPSFWQDGMGAWPDTGEEDIEECLGGQVGWHFHDPSGSPGGSVSTDLWGGWHSFGADWEPGSVTFYYDGVDVGSVTSGVTGSPMYLIMGLGIGGGYGGAVSVPATMRVQYVRVWQH